MGDFIQTVAAEAEANGIIVAVLAEARAKTDPTVAYTSIYFTIGAKVKDSTPTSQVYQIVERIKLWHKKQYDDNGQFIPTRYEYGDSVVYPEIPVYTMANGKVTSLNNYSPGPYVKAIYESGTYVGGHAGNYNIGDSVFITPYTTAIQKYIIQEAGGEQKKNYDLDALQRYVDFALLPEVKTLVPSSTPLYTDVIIVDTLPKGLSYVPNSSYFGGEYVQNPVPGQQGTIVGGIIIVWRKRNEKEVD